MTMFSDFALLDHEPFMHVSQAIYGTSELTVHRSAAIMRQPPGGFGGWHTDQSVSPTVEGANDVLNSLEIPNGNWFYLNGSRAGHSGIAVIDRSHHADWPGPGGYELINHGKTFRRVAEAPAGDEHPMELGVPGAVAVEAGPGDLIIFAARTYHSALRTEIDEPRLSCAMVFRPRVRHDRPWPLSEQTQAFLDGLAPRHRPYFEHYTSIDPAWRPADRAG